MARPSHTPKRAADSLSAAGRVAWWTLLACVAALPLITSIGLGAPSGTWASTADAYHSPKLLLLSALLLVATAAWLVDVLGSRRTVRLGTPLAALAAFAAFAAVSTAVAPEPLSSLFGASGLSTGTVTWLLCAWLAVLVGQYLVSARLVQISWATVGGGTVVALIALLQSAELDPLKVPINDMTVWMVRQGSSTLGNPDYTALALVLPTIVAVTLALAETVPLRRWAAIACASALAGAEFVTLTRASWLGVAVGLIAIVLLGQGDRAAKGRRLLLIGGGALAAAVVGYLLVGSGPVRDRFALLEGGFDRFTSGRVTLWGDVARIVARHPLFGTGADRLALGGFEVQRSLVLEGAGRFVLQDPHNAFLLVAGVFGLPALIALLAYIALAVRSGWRNVRAEGSGSRSRTLYVGWFSGLVGVLVAAVFSVWTISGVFVLFLGLGVVGATALKPLPDARRIAIGIVLGVLALVLAGVSLYGTARLVSAQHHTVLADIADSQSHLEEAIRLVPWDAKTRTDYYWRKINAMASVLQGADAAAARDETAQLDTELKLEITRFPRDLLFYRLRVDLYAISQGFPGYQKDAHLAAIDDALAVFPDDPEFTERREALVGTAE